MTANDNPDQWPEAIRRRMSPLAPDTASEQVRGMLMAAWCEYRDLILAASAGELIDHHRIVPIAALAGKSAVDALHDLQLAEAAHAAWKNCLRP